MKKLAPLLALFVYFNVSAQDGLLDPTFGTNGMVTSTDPNAYFQSGSAICVQPDNKILVAGYNATSVHSFNFCIFRYLEDGAVDNTFGIDGRVITQFPASSQIADIIVSGSKIIVAGYTIINTQQVFALAKYNEDGSPDTSFGIDGKVTTVLTATDNSGPNVIQLLPDGKLLVAGRTHSPTLPDLYYNAMARYNPDGSLDPTFGTNGITANTNSGAVSRFVVQSDQKILALGMSFYNFYAMRYLPDGSIDTSFGNNGYITHITQASDPFIYQMNDIQLLADDSFLLAGYAVDEMQHAKLVLLKYTANGTPESTFGTNGSVLYPNSILCPKRLLIQDDNKIVVGGTVLISNAVTHFFVARFNVDGSFDNTFGTDGVTQTPFADHYNTIEDIAFQNDGKLIALGMNEDINVLRYTRQNLSNEDFEPGQTIMAYPNPVTDLVHFSRPVKSATVYDIQGRMVKLEKQPTQSIDLSDLDSGIYLVSYEAGGNCYTVKVVKR